MGFHNRSTNPEYDARHHTPRRPPSLVVIALALMIAASAALLWAITRFPFASNQGSRMPAVAAPATHPRATTAATVIETATAGVSQSRGSSPTASLAQDAMPPTSPSPTNTGYGYDSETITITSFAYEASASTPTAVAVVQVTTATTDLVTLELYFAGGDTAGQPGGNAGLEHDFRLSGRTSYTVTDSVTALQFCYTPYVGVTASFLGESSPTDFRQLQTPPCT